MKKCFVFRANLRVNCLTAVQPNLRFHQKNKGYSSNDVGTKFQPFLSSGYLERILFIYGDKDRCPGNMLCEHLFSGVAKTHSGTRLVKCVTQLVTTQYYRLAPTVALPSTATSTMKKRGHLLDLWVLRAGMQRRGRGTGTGTGTSPFDFWKMWVWSQCSWATEIVRSRKFTDWWASKSLVSHLSIPKVRSALNSCSQAASADLVDKLGRGISKFPVRCWWIKGNDMGLSIVAQSFGFWVGQAAGGQLVEKVVSEAAFNALASFVWVSWQGQGSCWWVW
jgi:hypothetical protein